MTLLNALHWIRGPHAKAMKSASRQLLPAERLDFMIQRERDRADRRGIPFCLVTFTQENGRQSDLQKQLAPICLRRVRLTDDVGQLDRGRIAVLLPDTDEQGAWKVAHDISRTYETSTNEPRLEIEVRVYPEQRRRDQGGDNGDSGQRRRLPATTTNATPETTAPTASRVVSPLEPSLVLGTPFWKRTIDVLGATFGLLLLSPVLLVAAVGVRLSSKGPIFFLQERDGRGGAPFRMFKFRTMVDGAHLQQGQLAAMNEQDGPAFKIEEDPRVTRVGRFLRESSIDELPQLINVLRGEMSLVGPRPLPCGESDACENWQRQRLAVTPGLTCFWQIKDRRNKLPFDEWVRLDMKYIRSRSPMTDTKLILRTIASVVFGRRWE